MDEGRADYARTRHLTAAARDGMEIPGLTRLQEIIGVRFNDPNLLLQAVTHSSFEGGGPLAGNERLEFLGDAVLKLVTAWHLYVTCPEAPEGELSTILGRAVSEKALAEAAGRLGIADFLRVGRSLEASGGRRLPSVLADAFESILGAVFLDQGLEAAKRLAVRELRPGPRPDAGADAEETRNYKAILQEFFQKREKSIPEYEVVREAGPDHDKTFTVVARLAGSSVGFGSGKSKKAAEQAAAADALARLGLLPGAGGARVEG
ncbi:MAG: ribonuclease III [Firmicutes bacterium]|jgi:ribonuclease-3|nr:ribonuclease III [Bacillota bacterium]MDH7494907.1 ribonuclease III [Bacillota bacterium]